jgi:hypothetical protein
MYLPPAPAGNVANARDNGSGAVPQGARGAVRKSLGGASLGCRGMLLLGFDSCGEARMRPRMSFIGMMPVAVFAAACSSPPKQGTPAVTPDSRIPITATSDHGSAPGATNASISPAVHMDLVKEGYRPGTYRDQILYCRSEKTTGTAFSTRVCLTEEQVRDREAKTREAVDVIKATQGTGGCVVGMTC